MRRVLFLLLACVLLYETTVVTTNAQGYTYGGRIIGTYPECGKSRIFGVVLDEQGNPVTQPVRIRMWAEGETIQYHLDSGSSVSNQTGPSGFNYDIRYANGIYGNLGAPRYGTFYVAVVLPGRGYKLDEGLLSEPIKVTTEGGCGAESANTVEVEFRIGASTPPAAPTTPAPSPAPTSGEIVPVAADATCRAFTETAGNNGQFRVRDDENAQFLSAMNRYGLQNIGYPISQRYQRDGFVTQAFQKAILQWRSDTQSVAFVNIFDDLHTAGFDTKLKQSRQVPDQLPEGWDGTSDFATIVTKRQGLLDGRPALRTTYFAASDPITFFGLPTSEITDMGNHYAIRLQRAVLQEWKETVPWARAGEVTIANGGDIAKELGALPAAALQPEPLQ